MINTPTEKASAIIEHYGAEHQQVKLCEECGELIQAVCKAQENGLVITSDFISELADVEIMITQFKAIMPHYWRDEFEKEIAYKLNRQIARIENEK